MKKTQDYEIFKKHPNNRDINDLNVSKIVKSIKIKNLLQYRPIIVDKMMQVIDGQHRLEAAKKLNLPIYYQIQEEESTEDIFLLNANQKPWSSEDFLNYYRIKGNQNYIKLSKFKEKCGLSLKDIWALFGQHTATTFSSHFKEGKFEYPSPEKEIEANENLDRISTFIEYIREKTVMRKADLSSASLKRALVYFFNSKGFSFKIFMAKLEFKLDLFRRCTRSIDYLTIFSNIYNWKNRDPIQVNIPDNFMEHI